MKRIVILTLTLAALAVALSGCSRERVSRDGQPTLEPDGGYPDRAADSRPLVRELTSLSLERTPGGVIVHAEALTPTQGFWAPDLINVSDIPDAVSDTPAVLTFEFRAAPPVSQQPPSTERSRTLSAAVFVSNAELAGIRTIDVVASTNRRTLRR